MRMRQNQGAWESLRRMVVLCSRVDVSSASHRDVCALAMAWPRVDSKRYCAGWEGDCPGDMLVPVGKNRQYSCQASGPCTVALGGKPRQLKPSRSREKG